MKKKGLMDGLKAIFITLSLLSTLYIIQEYGVDKDRIIVSGAEQIVDETMREITYLTESMGARRMVRSSNGTEFIIYLDSDLDINLAWSTNHFVTSNIKLIETEDSRFPAIAIQENDELEIVYRKNTPKDFYNVTYNLSTDTLTSENRLTNIASTNLNDFCIDIGPNGKWQGIFVSDVDSTNPIVKYCNADDTFPLDTTTNKPENVSVSDDGVERCSLVVDSDNVAHIIYDKGNGATKAINVAYINRTYAGSYGSETILDSSGVTASEINVDSITIGLDDTLHAIWNNRRVPVIDHGNTRYINNSGGKWHTEKIINITNQDYTSLDYGTISIDGNGDIYILFHGQYDASPEDNIHYRYSNDNGVTWVPPLDTYPGNFSNDPTYKESFPDSTYSHQNTHQPWNGTAVHFLRWNTPTGDNCVYIDTLVTQWNATGGGPTDPPPEIANVSDLPDPQYQDGYVNISCDVTDNGTVSVVKCNITFPNATTTNTTMTNDGSYGYFFNDTYTTSGTHTYFIYAEDSNGNFNKSSSYTFGIVGTVVEDVYYVTTSGSDSNNGTAEIWAWRTLAYADGQLDAGDTLYVKAGNYGQDTLILPDFVGTGIIVIGYTSVPGDITVSGWPTFSTNWVTGEVTPDISMPTVYAEDGRPIRLGENNTIMNFFAYGDSAGAYLISLESYSTAIYCLVDKGSYGFFTNAGEVTDPYRTNIVFRNCTSVNQSARGFSIHRTHNSLFRDCFIENHYRTDYPMQFGKSTYNKIENITLRNYKTSKYGQLYWSHAGHGIDIRGGTTNQFWDVASNHNTIVNCTRDITTIGGFLNDVPEWARGVELSGRVNNNTVINDTSGSPWFHNGVDDNYFVNCTWGYLDMEHSIGEAPRQGVEGYAENDRNIFENCIFSGHGTGVAEDACYLSTSRNTTVINCVFYNHADALIYTRWAYLTNTISFRNCIFYQTGNRRFSDNQDGGSFVATFQHCCFYDNGFSAIGGEGNIEEDPLFINVPSGDVTTVNASNFHIKSQQGRWNGTAWVTDSVDSPCIDTGNESDSYTFEPSPNGNRINMGRFGNTDYASKTYTILVAKMFNWTGSSDAETWEDEGNWDSGDGTPGDDGYPKNRNDTAIIQSGLAHDILTPSSSELILGEFRMNTGCTASLTLQNNIIIDDTVERGWTLIYGGTFDTNNYTFESDSYTNIKNAKFYSRTGNHRFGRNVVDSTYYGLALQPGTALFEGGTGNHEISAMRFLGGTLNLTLNNTNLTASITGHMTLRLVADDFGHSYGNITFNGINSQRLRVDDQDNITFNHLRINNLGDWSFYKEYTSNITILKNLTITNGTVWFWGTGATKDITITIIGKLITNTNYNALYQKEATIICNGGILYKNQTIDGIFELNGNMTFKNIVLTTGSLLLKNGTSVDHLADNGNITLGTSEVNITDGSIYNFTYIDMNNTRADIYNATNISLHAWSSLPACSNNTLMGKGVYVNSTNNTATMDLRLYYDQSLVTGYNESNLRIFQYHNGTWYLINSTLNITTNTITKTGLTTFSYFIIGFEGIVSPYSPSISITNDTLSFLIFGHNSTMIGICRDLNRSYNASDIISQGILKVTYRSSTGIYYSYQYVEGIFYGQDFRIRNYSAYWVYADHDTLITFNVTQNVSVITYNFTSGWNLIAIPQQVMMDYLMTLNERIISIVVVRDSRFYSYTQYSQLYESIMLKPGEGIYIYCDLATRLVLV